MTDMKPISFFEASARRRVTTLVDAGSFREFCPPEQRRTSPHLARLNAPVAFDDGIVVGCATLEGRDILIAAQEGKFNGGAVGEVHGAKLVGLLDRGVRERPAGVLLLVDSGGVRLHEANAGLIAISEIMRAVLRCRAAGVPVFALVGGACANTGTPAARQRSGTPDFFPRLRSVRHLFRCSRTPPSRPEEERLRAVRELHCRQCHDLRVNFADRPA